MRRSQWTLWIRVAIGALAWGCASPTAPEVSDGSSQNVTVLNGDITATDELPFSVRIVWQTPADEATKAALVSAITRWQHVLSNTPNRTADRTTGGFCGGPARTAYGAEVLTLIVVPMSARQGTVAEAAPCEMRGDGTTRAGYIRIAAERFAEALPMTPHDIFAHEIGHVLGVTGNWFSRPGLTLPSGRTPKAGDTPQFLGAAARAGATAIGMVGGETAIAIETTDGSYAHWRGTDAAGDLMAWASLPNTRLSALTVGALADLGYRVKPSGAEALTVRGASFAEGSPLFAALPPRIQ